jgi:hypothetical protein
MSCLLTNILMEILMNLKIFFLARVDEPIDRNEIREKVLAHLISMTVQLKYLLVEQFEWLLHVVQYVSFLLSLI